MCIVVDECEMICEYIYIYMCLLGLCVLGIFLFWDVNVRVLFFSYRVDCKFIVRCFEGLIEWEKLL